MHGREYMRLNKKCLVLERREHLIQRYKKCLTRQHLRYMYTLIYVDCSKACSPEEIFLTDLCSSPPFSFRLLTFQLKPLINCPVFVFVCWKNIIKTLVSWPVWSRFTQRNTDLVYISAPKLNLNNCMVKDKTQFGILEFSLLKLFAHLVNK